MTEEELNRYVDARIEKALKSRTGGLALDPGLISQLDEVEAQLRAVIVALRGLPPELGCWARFSKAYNRIRKDGQQDVDAGTDEFDRLFDKKRRIFRES